MSTFTQASEVNIDIDIDIESANEKQRWPTSLSEPAPAPAPTTATATAYLNGLRGLAALLVYFSHNVPWWYGVNGAVEHGFGYHGEHMVATLPFLRTLFSGGSAAVTLFFVMSGYVLSVTPLQMMTTMTTRTTTITMVVLRHDDDDDGNGNAHNHVHTTRHYLLSAALRRPFRLYVPVAAVSLVFALCMHLPFGLTPRLSWPVPEPSVRAELWRWACELAGTMNIFVKHGIYTHWFPYAPAAWTMAAELRGSLAVFALLALSVSATAVQRFVLFAASAVCLLFLYQWELAGFMFGVALLIANREHLGISHRLLPRRAKAVFAHCMLLVGWYLLGQPSGGLDAERSQATPGWYYLTRLTPAAYYRDEFWRFWTTIGAVMLLYAVTNISWIQSLLMRPAVQYLGKVSFSLYLIHGPIMWTLGDRLARLFGVIRQDDFTTVWDKLLPVPDWGPLGFSTGFLVWQAFVLPLNLYLAALATRRVDEPSVRLAKWLALKVQRKG